jgi:hypothetical protein
MFFYLGFNQVSHQNLCNQPLENYLVKSSGVRRTWTLPGKQEQPQLNWIQKEEQSILIYHVCIIPTAFNSHGMLIHVQNTSPKHLGIWTQVHRHLTISVVLNKMHL